MAIPWAGAGLALGWRSNGTRPRLLPAVCLAHTFLTFWLFLAPPPPSVRAWMAFDAPARALLPAVSLLFLLCSFYAVAYLRLRAERPNRVFIGSWLGLLGLLSLALQARHLGLLWIAAEGATLATVPLLHFNGTARAYEATWKYLLVGGTGMALCLLGSFCLGYASVYQGGMGDLTFDALAAQGRLLQGPWLTTAWVLLLAGYGTKMGLAPMHTWKPDAYGEAPGVVGAVLAGGLTTMAFVAILRAKQVMAAAGAGGMASTTMLALGLFSMLVAAFFLLGTPDFKRMLAYSSVEHMGILSLGAALGGGGLWAALFHVWSNSLTKGALFLSAGNLRRAAGARTIPEVSGMIWRCPVSARLMVVGMLAITACPPFGPFFSELNLMRAAFESARSLVMAVFLAGLLLAFLGMTRLVFAVVDGRPRRAMPGSATTVPESPGLWLPPLLFLLASLLLGLAAPAALTDAWTAAARQLAPTP